MIAFLVVLAGALVVGGITAVVRGFLLWGVAMIVLGLAVGPGGVSIFA